MSSENSQLEPYIDILNNIGQIYYGPLREYLDSNQHLIKTFTAFLLSPQHIAIYIGRAHIAIEYFGNEKSKSIPDENEWSLSCFDYSIDTEPLLDRIIGFSYDSTVKGGFKFPLPPFSEDLILPTNKGIDELLKLKWNFVAQNGIIGINSPGFEIYEGESARIINGRFYDADEHGLKTRHIKWIDFLPLSRIDNGNDTEILKINTSMLTNTIQHVAHYTYPEPSKKDFKNFKLPRINRFIEIIGTKESSETAITSFLESSDNKFILTMGFMAKEIYGQVICNWQSQDRPAIKPDFFIVKPDGYADIVEFKLPNLKSSLIVGKANRETFSSEVNSYISQTRVYSQYFEDPNNRKWFEEKYGFKVRYPRRILVMGRRWDFGCEEWREIKRDYSDLDIISFDELVDGVVAQFYL